MSDTPAPIPIQHASVRIGDLWKLAVFLVPVIVGTGGAISHTYVQSRDEAIRREQADRELIDINLAVLGITDEVMSMSRDERLAAIERAGRKRIADARSQAWHYTDERAKFLWAKSRLLCDLTTHQRRATPCKTQFPIPDADEE